MNNWSRNKNELQTESSQELVSCLWCDTDSSVCKSISCFSGLLLCSFWYFQLSQDFSSLVTCVCTTSVSKPEIWSSRVASGREVTCRKKWAQNGGGALDGLRAVDWAGVRRRPRRALCEERGEVWLRFRIFLSAVTSPYTSWPLPPTCTPVPTPQQLCSVYSTYRGCRPGPGYSLPDCLLCLLLIVQPSAFTRQPTSGRLPLFPVGHQPSPVSCFTTNTQLLTSACRCLSVCTMHSCLCVYGCIIMPAVTVLVSLQNFVVVTMNIRLSVWTTCSLKDLI